MKGLIGTAAVMGVIFWFAMAAATVTLVGALLLVAFDLALLIGFLVYAGEAWSEADPDGQVHTVIAIIISIIFMVVIVTTPIMHRLEHNFHVWLNDNYDSMGWLGMVIMIPAVASLFGAFACIKNDMPYGAYLIVYGSTALGFMIVMTAR